MSCVNVILVEPRQLMVGVDSYQATIDQSGRVLSTETTEKLHQVSAAPIIVTGRGWSSFISAVAAWFRWYPFLIRLRPCTIARLLTVLFRFGAWCSSAPNTLDMTQVVIAGWDRRRETMFIHDFRQQIRSAGFHLEPDGPFVAPYDDSIERVERLAALGGVAPMFDLLVAQIDLLNRHGFHASAPLTVAELTPGRIQRFTLPRLPPASGLGRAVSIFASSLSTNGSSFRGGDILNGDEAPAIVKPDRLH